ncbi:MAG TPA: hypothetical protein VFG04_29660 [Planctomycetaceae bacterium]|jgi:hypothetical protein|nr:hypothetical protein [Planctomycetaceae bacterium]
MSQPAWPEEGRQPDHGNRSGQRPPDDWSEQPPRPPSGMSGGMKACLVVLCVVGFCCLLCCGGFGYFGYSMVPKIATSPADINAAREEIAKIDLPPGFEPKNSAKIDNWFCKVTMVEYSNPGHANLMMLQMLPKFGGPDAVAPMRQSIEKQRVTNVEVGPMANAKVETKTLKIKGKDYTFTFTTGEEGAVRVGKRMPGDKMPTIKTPPEKTPDKAPADKTPADKGPDNADKGAAPAKKSIRHHITGDFDGKNGLVLIDVDFDDTYKEADIVKMLEGIQ